MVILPHSTDFGLGLLNLDVAGSPALVSLSCGIMLTAAVGAVALTIAALPALDRFLRW